jgi:hypothetical protein
MIGESVKGFKEFDEEIFLAGQTYLKKMEEENPGVKEKSFRQVDPDFWAE